jgi:tRNA A37 threonylcarbamoyladenosine dehydratase
MRHERLIPIFTQEGLDCLKRARVAVIGLGGVGGIAAETLARSGVGHLLLCDFDRIESSNINRQVIANDETLGRYKG